jgi:trk system potassium uptake protein TrkA
VYEAELLSLNILYKGEAKVLEYRVSSDVKLVGKKLKKIRFPREAVVGAIVRGTDVIIPRGDDEIRAGDRVIIFTRTGIMDKLSEMFGGKPGVKPIVKSYSV